jgi:hypothetical protein
MSSQRPLPSPQSQLSTQSSVDTHGTTPLVNMFTGPPSYAAAATIRPPLSQSPFASAPPATQLRRFLHVQFAPHLPQSSAEFLIETDGIRGTSSFPDAMLQCSPTSPLSIHNRSEPAPTAMPFSMRSYAPLAPTFQPPPPQPTPSSTSYLKNMYTPAGGARSTSYFDEDAISASQEDREAAALAAAEAEMMRAREAAHATMMAVPILDAMAVITSPTIRAPVPVPTTGQQQYQYQPPASYMTAPAP